MTRAEDRLKAAGEKANAAAADVRQGLTNLGEKIKFLIEKANSPKPADLDESYLEDDLALIEQGVSGFEEFGRGLAQLDASTPDTSAVPPPSGGFKAQSGGDAGTVVNEGQGSGAGEAGGASSGVPATDVSAGGPDGETFDGE